MKNKTNYFIFIFISFLFFLKPEHANAQQQIFQLKTFILKSESQVERVDSFLKNTYLPELHKHGIAKIGVFKPIANDTSAFRKIIVFIPYNSLQQWKEINEKILHDSSYKNSGKSFLNAAANNIPFEREESVLLEAMPIKPRYILPSSKSATRVFELRDYESPTESLLEKKLSMFNNAGETDIFKRLDFAPVFYSKVISGNHMPDLMYMVSFESVAARDAHWKAFGEDAQWKKISTDPQYENNVSVSHIESTLMHATDYSDF